MGTRESMYFLSSLFYSKRKHMGLYLAGAYHSCGKWGFLSQFVMAPSFSRLLYILFPVSWSFVFGSQNQYQYNLQQVVILQCSHVLTDSGFCQGGEVFFLFAGWFNLMDMSFSTSQQHIQCLFFHGFVLQPRVKSGRKISKHLIV